MSRLALTVVRFASAAWVGAAVLFVVNAVQMTISRKFESIVLDQLALLRFPTFYVVGFVLVGAAFVSSALTGGTISLRRRGVLLGLFGLALVVMLFDYLVIYLPLAKMINPPGQPRPEQFRMLHRWSEITNLGGLLLVLLGAGLASWPPKAACEVEKTA